jgi:hypothetical protein
MTALSITRKNATLKPSVSSVIKLSHFLLVMLNVIVSEKRTILVKRR